MIRKSECENLLGPAVIGAIMGVLAAICLIAFDSEYGAEKLLWQRILDPILGLLTGFMLAFVPFGLAPVLIGRLVRSFKKR